MPLTRRGFVSACLALCTPPLGQDGRIIRLTVAGAPGREGFDMAVEEMSRTVALLGHGLDVGDARGAPSIDLEAGSVASAGESLFVPADAAARHAALEAWRREHQGPAHAAVEWHAALEKFGAEQLNARFRRRSGRAMESADWIGWMLVKVAVESELRGRPARQGRYDGHKGAALIFGRDGRLVQPLCMVDREGRLLGLAGT